MQSPAITPLFSCGKNVKSKITNISRVEQSVQQIEEETINETISELISAFEDRPQSLLKMIERLNDYSRSRTVTPSGSMFGGSSIGSPRGSTGSLSPVSESP